MTGLDKTLLGTKAGISAGVICGLISQTLHTLGMGRICMVKTASAFYSQQVLTATKFSGWTILGWTGHLIISAVLGVILVYLFSALGKEYAWLKGMMFGALVWIFDYGFVGPLSGFILPGMLPRDYFIVLGYHLLFGLIAAWYIMRYSHVQES